MLTDSEQAAINRSLENILADEKFLVSPQMSAFLRYIVTETLRGNANRIKAYTVGVDALGKSEAFDPQTDPSVRVLAKRLRSSLDQYYERTSDHEVIIEVKAGSYIPQFSKPAKLGVSDKPKPPYDAAQDAQRLSERRIEHRHDSNTLSTQPTPESVKFSLADETTRHTEVESDRANDNAITSASGDSSVAKEPDKTNLTSASVHEVLLEKKLSELSEHLRQNVVADGDEQENTHNVEVVQPPKERFTLSKLLTLALEQKALAATALFFTITTMTLGFSQWSADSNTAKSTVGTKGDNYTLQLASASTTKAVRQRPPVPTVIVRTDNRADKISQSLLSSISHVVSKFDHVQVIKSTAEYELSEKWPEDYEIHVDTLLMKNGKKITVNLINAASGRITFSDELLLKNSDTSVDLATVFSKENISDVELFVARIVQKDGPLIADYKIQENYSDTMSCVFSGRMFKPGANSNCMDRVIANGPSESIQHILHAELSSRDITNSSGSKRKKALKVALAAAKRGIAVAPHSADAHALMMRVHHLSGDYATALKHGNYALDINAFDSRNLFELAALLDDMKKPEEAQAIRRQANHLSISLSDISL